MTKAERSRTKKCGHFREAVSICLTVLLAKLTNINQCMEIYLTDNMTDNRPSIHINLSYINLKQQNKHTPLISPPEMDSF